MKPAQRIRFLGLILLLQAALGLTLASTYFLGRLPKELVPTARRDAFQVVKKITFQGEKALLGWEEKVFCGKTVYRVLSEGSQSFLRATSHGASSGLYMKFSLPASPNLRLSWEWRAQMFPQKKDPNKLADRSQDDFAARVYVVFLGSNFFNSNVIEYIWDENIPEKTFESSAFSQRIKLFVIRSGKPKPGDPGWRQEERNVYEDYKLLFGKEPDRPIGAVALMSDSDNTQTVSEADFKDLTFKLKEDPKTPNRGDRR
ncbi:MAG: DUF3047 domain-containing protein [Candidatus Omnitrophica bacterium]|nr:DUF3047 domain-containing protein [Candidatus Omnitrophota bacterium]